MAAQEVGLPGSATGTLEHLLAGLAEGAQAVVAGEHDLTVQGAGFARIACHHPAHEPMIGRIVERRLRRVEAGMVEELPHRTGQNETTMGIGGRWSRR